jgi:hypothetical protein
VPDWIVMLGLLLFSFFLSAFGTKFCANIDSTTSGGASGYFSAQFTPGSANYSYYLDLTHFDTGTCDLTSGLSFHFHTYWKNSSVSSSSNSFCGGSFTGGHFDPNLACGPSSQDAGNKCVDLGRTSTSTPPYIYSCNTTNYQKGRYAYCELGDIAGKFGRAFANTGTRIFEHLAPLEDFQPPYVANYKQGDALSYQWQSIVFHCGQTNDRLVCAEFLMTDDDEECGTSTNSNSNDDNNDPWSTGGWNSLSKLLVGLSVGIVVIGVVAGVVIWRKKSKDEDRTPLNV